MRAAAHGTRLRRFVFLQRNRQNIKSVRHLRGTPDVLRHRYLFELGQTRDAAEFLSGFSHLQHDRRAAVGATVLTDRQLVHVAEAEETGIAADLVDDVVLYDLMLALQEDGVSVRTAEAYMSGLIAGTIKKNIM